MTARRIEKLLINALIYDGEMPYALYEYELEERLDQLKSSMAEDNDDFIFTVTENTGDVAMLLIEKSGQTHINEQAREWLKEFWSDAYESNMRMLIPDFAKKLSADTLPINGVRTVRRRRRSRTSRPPQSSQW